MIELEVNDLVKFNPNFNFKKSTNSLWLSHLQKMAAECTILKIKQIGHFEVELFCTNPDQNLPSHKFFASIDKLLLVKKGD